MKHRIKPKIGPMSKNDQKREEHDPYNKKQKIIYLYIYGVSPDQYDTPMIQS